MAIKTTGAEWKKFYTDPDFWPDGTWHDDEEITVNGDVADADDNLEMIDDSAAVTVAGGVVFIHEGDDDGPTLEAYFKRWRKKQTTVFLSVEVSKDKVDAVAAAIAHAGGKLSRTN